MSNKKDFIKMIDRISEISDVIIYETKDCKRKYKKSLKKIKEKVEKEGLESIQKRWLIYDREKI